MHPKHNMDRIKARVETLHEHLSTIEEAVHINIAEHPGQDAFTIEITNHNGSPPVAASIKASNSEEAEEAAITLAITSRGAKYLLSDSNCGCKLCQ